MPSEHVTWYSSNMSPISTNSPARYKSSDVSPRRPDTEYEPIAATSGYLTFPPLEKDSSDEGEGIDRKMDDGTADNETVEETVEALPTSDGMNRVSPEVESQINGSSRMASAENISVPASLTEHDSVGYSALKSVEPVSESESIKSESLNWACRKQLKSYPTPESETVNYL